MPLFETFRGTRQVIQWPPETEWFPELHEAVAEYTRLLDERRQVGLQVEFATTDLEKLERTYQKKMAEHLRGKGEAPKRDRIEKKRKSLEEAVAKLPAFEIALDEQERTIVELIEKHRARWIAKLNGEMNAARERFRAALTELHAARDDLTTRERLVPWLEQFPSSAKFRAGSRRRVNLLQAPHGEPYAWNEVLHALRADAEPHEPIQRPKLGGPDGEYLVGQFPYGVHGVDVPSPAPAAPKRPYAGKRVPTPDDLKAQARGDGPIIYDGAVVVDPNVD
jgi:hypothetical protein